MRVLVNEWAETGVVIPLQDRILLGVAAHWMHWGDFPRAIHFGGLRRHRAIDGYSETRQALTRYSGLAYNGASQEVPYATPPFPSAAGHRPLRNRANCLR